MELISFEIQARTSGSIGNEGVPVSRASLLNRIALPGKRAPLASLMMHHDARAAPF
jgi:hypothetical protein